MAALPLRLPDRLADSPDEDRKEGSDGPAIQPTPLSSRLDPAVAAGLASSPLHDSDSALPSSPPTLRSQFSVDQQERGQALPNQQTGDEMKTDETKNDEGRTFVQHSTAGATANQSAGCASAPSNCRFSRDARPAAPSYALQAWNPAAPALPSDIRALDEDESMTAVPSRAPAIVAATPFGSNALARIELHRQHQRTVAQDESGEPSSNAVRLHIGGSSADNDAPSFPRLPRPTRVYSPPSGTKPQLPLSSPRIWRGVPKELMSIMASYMDAGSLARFAGTEKLACAVADDRKLWTALAQLPCAYSTVLDGRPPLHVDAKSAPRRFIAQRRQDYIYRRRKLIASYEQSLAHARIWQRGWYCHWIVHYALPLFVACLLLTSFIALIVELELHRSVGWTTFGPLLAAVFLVLLCATSFICWSKRRRLPWQLTDAEKLQLCLPATFYAQTLSPIKSVMESLGSGSGQSRKDGLAHASFYCMLIVLVVALVNLAVKLSHPAAIGWLAFFVPLYVAFAVVLAGPWLRWKTRLPDWWRSGDRLRWRLLEWWRSDDPLRWRVFCAFWLTWGLPLLAFAVMLHLKVDGYCPDLSLAHLAIPLWVADGVSFVRLLGNRCANPVAVCRWLFVWPGGGIAFKLVVVLFWDTRVSRGVLFLPLYPAALLLLVQLPQHLVDVQDHSDVEWRKTPVHPAPVLLPV